MQYFNTTDLSTIKQVNSQSKALKHKQQMEEQQDIATIRQKPFYMRAREQSERSRLNKENALREQEEFQARYEMEMKSNKSSSGSYSGSNSNLRGAQGGDSSHVDNGVLVLEKFEVPGKGLWEKAYDPKSKQFYYFNRASGVSQWESPS
jgi:hypothetical protein